ncbi:MAG: helix-turn-helix transcriptional regulator [Bacteroidales bacterium]|nr:helix-turn-helix transcriptional regulator [Bacteroidales bacterium]
MDYGHTLDESTMRDNLRKARMARGLTQAEVADFLNISVTAYQKIESGKTHIINEHYLKCAELFGISAAELVNGYEPERDTSAIFADLKQSYGNRIIEMEKHYIGEIQLREMEIRRLRETIKDKENLISTQEMLIERVMGGKTKE